MSFDISMIKNLYQQIPTKLNAAQKILNKSLTLTEKILLTHLIDSESLENFNNRDSYMNFSPDRVAMQDATAQMALLQFMQSKRDKVAVPTTVHCDHLITAKSGSKEDLNKAIITNKEVYEFLSSTSAKYGIGFWKPGAGIIHQVILENYAFPGGMMIGTDSHTVNAGGLGMIAIGVGGADACDVMASLPWELKFPKIIGIKLTGTLSGWTSPKDIILKLSGMLTATGGTGYILEYFGEGAENLSCTGKASIANMGAEIGATTSIFGYDKSMERYLKATNRSDIADLASQISQYLKADEDVYINPEKYFDKLIEINLSELEPYINGPFSPDVANPISTMKEAVVKNNWPSKIEIGLIGSCTNSSYEDISRATSIVKQALQKNISLKSNFTITPGSEQIQHTITRDGLLDDLKQLGVTVFANACGPCIGMWDRIGSEKEEKNTIIHSFNRNFAKRVDGNPNTFAFVASPEIVTALVLAGDLTFNPITDFYTNNLGEKIKLNPPQGIELPENGFVFNKDGFIPAPDNSDDIEIKIDPNSARLQILQPFDAWNGLDLLDLQLLIKVKGKCTTDHISMAGPWLKFRGHLDNISNNMLIGAVNFFNDKTNLVKNHLTNQYEAVPQTQRDYKAKNIGSIVIGDENYGEGSSREHAAMEPRYLGVKVVLAKSFARIHETNLKKQGILALTFNNKADYLKIQEDDIIDIIGLNDFSPNKMLKMILRHNDNSQDEIILNHSYSAQQIEWFKAGSALNCIKNTNNKI